MKAGRRSPAEADAAALEELWRLGARPEEPMLLDNWFRCPGEAQARRLANLLQVAGLAPELAPPDEEGEPWEVAATVEVRPVAGAVAAMRADLEAAARSAGAEYDGWEAEPPGSF